MFCERCKRFSTRLRVRCECCLLLLGRSCDCAQSLKIGYCCRVRAGCDSVKAMWTGGVIHAVAWTSIKGMGRVSYKFKCAEWILDAGFIKFHRRKSTEVPTCIACLALSP